MDENSITIPLRVVHSRFTAIETLRSANGESINWQPGDPAWETSPSGNRRRVIIDSERVGHSDLPGKACYECIVEPHGQRWCVPAERLTIAEDWKP